MKIVEPCFIYKWLLCFQTWAAPPCLPDPSPDVVWLNLHLRPSSHSAPVSVIGRKPWQGKLFSYAGKKEAKHGFGLECEGTAVFVCTFSSRLASLPVAHPDLGEPGQGVPLSPICRLHPALLLPPIFPFSPSSVLPPFSLADPRPRIAQQVPSENRAGDVGRVKLSLALLSTFYLSPSLSGSLFLSEMYSEKVISRLKQ